MSVGLIQKTQPLLTIDQNKLRRSRHKCRKIIQNKHLEDVIGVFLTGEKTKRCLLRTMMLCLNKTLNLKNISKYPAGQIGYRSKGNGTSISILNSITEVLNEKEISQFLALGNISTTISLYFCPKRFYIQNVMAPIATMALILILLEDLRRSLTVSYKG